MSYDPNRLNQPASQGAISGKALAAILLGGGGALAYLLHEREKRVFVSYDHDHDRKYRYLLTAWSANQSFALKFEDRSTSKVDSNDQATIKRAIARRLNSADYLLVVVGPYTHRSKWVSWEIAKAKELGLKLIAVKVKPTYISPPGLLRSKAVWARSFTADSITKAVSEA